MRISPSTLNLFAASIALTEAPAACTRPTSSSVSIDSGVRTNAPRMTIVNTTGPNDPLLAQAHAFLSRLSSTPAYSGIVEPLEQIRRYMTPDSGVYDGSYRWKVLLGDHDVVMGVSVTWTFRTSNNTLVTVVDYHTPSEVRLPGVSPMDFPAFSSQGVTMVEVQPGSPGLRYYGEQGFVEAPFRYHHIATETPLEALLLIKTSRGTSVTIDDILTNYVRILDSDGTNTLMQDRLRANLRSLRHQR